MDFNRAKAQTLIISAIAGAVAGLSIGYMLLKRAEENEGQPTITPGEGVSLGLMILGMLRQVAQLGDGD